MDSARIASVTFIVFLLKGLAWLLVPAAAYFWAW
jgi:hypothetical protein